MNPAPAFLLAAIIALGVYSLPLSLLDERYSALDDGDRGLGAWIEPGATGAVHRTTEAQVHLRHGPLGDLDPATDALLIVAPRLSYDDAEVQRLTAFLTAGGRALIADDVGSGRALVAALQLRVEISADGVFSSSYDRTPAFPLATSTGAVSGMPDETVLSRPRIVLGAGETVLATHPFTWTDRDHDLRPALDEPRGSVALARLVPVGRGQLLVLGDPDLLTPGGDALADGAGTALWEWLADDRRILIDEGHRARSDPVGIAPVLAGARPIAIVAVALGVGVASAWALLGVRIRRVRVRREPPQVPRHIVDELA